MKKIISLVLLLSLIISSIPVWAENTEAATECKETLFLKSIGVLEAGFSEGAQITKSEFTKRIVKLLYPEVNFSTLNPEGIFSDVNSSTVNGAYIKAAYDLKIINGDTSNMFHPESPISSTQAIVIADNALGYTMQANAMGGYPTGYLMVANLNGLTKGLGTQEAVDGLYMAKILYNVLFLFPTTVESITVDGIKISENRSNVLESVYNITKYNAVLWDNGLTSLDGNSINDEERCVIYDSKNENYITAYTGDTDIHNHLGSRMDVYVKYNDSTARSEIVNYSLDKNSKEYLINADRILKLDASGIEYEEEKNSQNIQSISFKNEYPVVVLNGVILSGYDFNNLIPADGFIRVPVNSGSVECVEIISFNIYDNGVTGTSRYIVTDSFDFDEGYINCKLSPTNTLDFTDDDSIRFILNDNIKSFNDLEKGMIISVAQSYEKVNNGYVYLLAVSDGSVNGAVTSVAEADKVITVNDVEYEVSDNLLSVKNGFIKNIKYNEEIKFYIDATGKIAYSDTNAVGLKNYAYLINAGVQTKGEGVLLLKLLTKDGTVAEYEAADKIKIDGNEYTDVKLAYNKLISRPAGSEYTDSVKKPVIVDFTGEGYVRSINTDMPDAESEDDINIYSSHTHIKYSDEEVLNSDTLKAGYRSPRVGFVHKGKNNSVDGRFYINEDTVIFAVPEIDLYGLDVWTKYASNDLSSYKVAPEKNIAKEFEMSVEDKYYRLYDAASLSTYYCYDIQGYDIDPDTGFAGLVVLRGRTDIYWYGRVPHANTYPMSVFLRKTQYYDEEMEQYVTKLYYTSDGYTESSAIIDTNNTYSSYKYMIEGSKASDNAYGADVPALKPGDVIRVFAKDGRVAHLERVFRIDNVFKSHSSKSYPLMGYAPYSKSGYVTSVPFDEREAYMSYTGNYTIITGYIRNVTGNSISQIAGRDTVKDIVATNPLTYSEHIYSVSNIIPITVTLKSTGNIVEKGDLSDIVTIDEAGGDLSKASLVIVKSTNFDVNTVIIINKGDK